ncbi:MAG: SIR2 family protein [Firmicutes bacterium]|nr:SIR2 family protein [Bacillota bacterium]
MMIKSEIGSKILDAGFEIGGEDKLAEHRSILIDHDIDEDVDAKLETTWKTLITNLQIQVGTLLKTDTVSFLFGAGTSKDCGGVLIGNIPIEVERELLREGIYGQGNIRIHKWLRYFYYAVKQVNQDDPNIPFSRDEIIQRQALIGESSVENLKANYERVLSLLYQWRSAMLSTSGRLWLDGSPPFYLESQELDECIRQTKKALVHSCQLPKPGLESGMEIYKKFIKKILTRPLNLKRTNIFTLNYDTLVEQAADSEGVVLIDGFVGTLKRVFHPECYDQDLYFPAETTEGRVHRHDRVIHLYKLHGSITWVTQDPNWDNPYGLVANNETTIDKQTVVIYPTPTKYGETLGMPYAELFRRFATTVGRHQSTLFVIGYGFGDEHVNTLIWQALAIPSFTLVIIDPSPQSDFVRKLRERKDKRIWIFSGQTLGTFAGFVEHVLPDLRDEDVQQQIMATYRALKPEESARKGGLPDV